MCYSKYFSLIGGAGQLHQHLQQRRNEKIYALDMLALIF